MTHTNRLDALRKAQAAADRDGRWSIALALLSCVAIIGYVIAILVTA